MKHLDNINPNKFYAQLVHHGHLIEEVVEGVDQDGNWSSFYDFEDAIIDAEYEGVILNECGNAKYYFEGKIYDVVVFLENYEGSGINELELEEIEALISKLRNESEEAGYSESDFLNKEPWVKEFSNSLSSKILNFSGNMGDLILNITGIEANGTYQENGILKGEFVNNAFQGQWKNKGMEGLVKFKIIGNKLEGNWKKGLNHGAMRGEWKAVLVENSDSEGVKQYKNREISNRKIIDELCKDLDQYKFFHFGSILHHMIEELGAENTGKAIDQMVEEETHYNLLPSIKHIYDKWGYDDKYFSNISNITNDFIENYIEMYNGRIPNLRKHITRKAKQNFGDNGAVWSMINGYSGYIVKDIDDWKKLKGPVGLAVRLCGCESFDQVMETEAVDEFSKHITNIFFYTIKEIEELPIIYQQNLKDMLATTIDSIYHHDPDWNLENTQGILTNAIGSLLYHEFGLDFNDYIVEMPIEYSCEELSKFGVTWLNIQYPVDYDRMATDILALKK